MNTYTATAQTFSNTAFIKFTLAKLGRTNITAQGWLKE